MTDITDLKKYQYTYTALPTECVDWSHNDKFDARALLSECRGVFRGIMSVDPHFAPRTIGEMLAKLDTVLARDDD